MQSLRYAAIVAQENDVETEYRFFLTLKLTTVQEPNVHEIIHQLDKALDALDTSIMYTIERVIAVHELSDEN